MTPHAQVTLSPLNLHSMTCQLRSAEYEMKSEVAGKVEEVILYRCPICEELHEWESDAEECCTADRTPIVTNQGKKCPCCGQLYESHRDAADCCLWKDLDAYTRWQIADAVEGGSDWLAELGKYTAGRHG